MFQKISDKFLKIEECTGVELAFLSGGELLISGVVLRLEKNKIVKKKEFHFLSSYEDLVQKAGVKAPLAITINGRGVLQKKMEARDLTDRPVEAMLPNANPNDFYHSVTPIGELATVAVIRKETLDKIIADLQQKGFRVLSAAIGITDLPNLLPFFSFDQRTFLSTPFYSLVFDEQQQLEDIEFATGVTPTEYDKVEYNIGDQYVYSTALTGFASATGLLASGPDTGAAFSQTAIQQEKENYKYFRYYKAGLWAMLAGLFTILLVNFFIYNHYFSLNKDREGMRQLSQEQEDKLKKQSAALRQKEDFLSQSGWEASSRLSYFADRIAGLVPSGTLLTDMQINPVNNGLLGDDKGIRFRRDTIQVTGTCDDPTELNQFTNNLKNIQDFKTVSIRNYAYKKEIRSGTFFMEIITR